MTETSAFLAPVHSQKPVAVSNIYGIGRNYRDHAAELGNAAPKEPIVFLKATTSLRSLKKGSLAFEAETFHHEAELVLLVGQTVPLGSKAGWDAVRAVTLGLDLTRRDKQTELKKGGLPWTLAKSFAGAALLGEFLPLTEVKPTPENLRFQLEVQGELRQSGDIKDMIFDVPTILTFLAAHAPLVPGDVIFTGTPQGVGPIRRGESFCLAFVTLGRKFEGVL